jgi:hypothetical protein
MKTSHDTPNPKSTLLTLLAPQEGDVCSGTFSVSGSLDAADGTAVQASVSGSGNDPGSTTVMSEGWSVDFTRIPGSYTASATGDGLSSGSVNFTVQGSPVIGIISTNVIDELPPPPVTDPKGTSHPKKKVTVQVRCDLDPEPIVTAALLVAQGMVDRDDPQITEQGNGKWKVVFRNVDPGVYAARVTWHVNDRRVSTSVLIRAK